MEEHYVPLMAVTALACIVVMLLNTRRKKPSADHEQTVRSAILQLFKLATSKDYAGAATLLLGEQGVLRYSQQPEEVERRCRDLQELAAGGGISIDRVLPQGDEGHPDYVCELSVVGAQRLDRQQRWRWTGDRYALLES
ncbi:MAG: hypothetical protein AMXMBFR33_11600 [Candidatus Xenobia bacterium]